MSENNETCFTDSNAATSKSVQNPKYSLSSHIWQRKVTNQHF